MSYSNIDKSTNFFNTKLYTGNGGTQSITGVGFQPDWSWFKKRNNAADSSLIDAVRGVRKSLTSNNAEAEYTETTGLASWDSDGFSFDGAGYDHVNTNGDTFASWNWKAGTAVSGNTSGSGTYKTYTGSVNTTSGFSIIKYVGNGTAGHTIPHHLGIAPKMVIVKSVGANEDWMVGHTSVGFNKFMILNSDVRDASGTQWNSTTPTNSVFSIGSNNNMNQNGNSFIAICFAEKTGYSKIGSYTGNNQTGNNAPFIATGFAPTFLLVKKYSNSNHWIMWDNKRSTKNGFNIIDKKLYANIANAENGAEDVSFLSNGFKFNTNTGDWNESEDYLYLCFGQSIVGSNNVPCTAR